VSESRAILRIYLVMASFCPLIEARPQFGPLIAFEYGQLMCVPSTTVVHDV